MGGIWTEHGAVTVSFDIQLNLSIVTIAGKLGLEVPPGTFNSVLKQAGLKD